MHERSHAARLDSTLRRRQAFWAGGTPPAIAAHRALVAARFGWMLDAFDVMLFSLVLAAVIADLGLTKPQAGLLGSITLLGGAGGGLVFGRDRRPAAAARAR